MRNCTDCGRDFRSSGHLRCDRCRRPYQHKGVGIVVEAFGERKNAVEWAKDPRCLVTYSTLRARIFRDKWPPEIAITSPKSYRYYEQQSVCDECGMVFATGYEFQRFCGLGCKNSRGSAVRRVREQEAFVDYINRQELFDAYRGCCYLCWLPLPESWHLEHITPLARGGKHELANVAPACPPCNRKKHTKTFTEFVRAQYQI